MNNQIKIQRLLEQAQSFAKERKPRDAIATAEQVLELDPENAEAHYLCGTNFEHSTEWSAMKRATYNRSKGEHLKIAIEIDPSHVQAYMALAQMHSDNRPKNPIEEFTKIIERFPGYSEAYEKRGYIHRNNKNYGLAIADFSEAIRLSPDNPGLYISRGHAFLNKNQYKETRDDFNKAISLDPKNDFILKNIALAFEKNPDLLDINDFEKTIEEYKEHLGTDTSESENRTLSLLYKILGTIYAEQGKHEQAADTYKQSIEYVGNKKSGVIDIYEIHYLLGITYSKLGKYKEAIVEFDQTQLGQTQPGQTHHFHRKYPGVDEKRSKALLNLVEKQESDFQEKIEKFLSGPNSIFELQDHFFKREKECDAHYQRTTVQIRRFLWVTFGAIVLGVGGISYLLIYHPPVLASIEKNAFSLLPYIGIVLLLAAVPVWWTRILLRVRDRWLILREDCFRKASIMQYVKATGRDEEFRNQIILETIRHMENRSGADLLLALHTDDPGMLYSVTDIIEKVLKKRHGKR